MAPPGDDHMVEVDLQDDEKPVGARERPQDDHPDEPIAEEPPPPSPGDVMRRRLANVAKVAAVLVVLAVATVANVREHAEDARRAAALATMPGVVASLDEPLQVVWERQGPVVGQSGVLLGVADQAMAPLDPASGEVVPIPRAAGQQLDECVAVAATEPSMLVCWRFQAGDLEDPSAPAQADLVGATIERAELVVERPAPRPTMGFLRYFGLQSGAGSVDGDLVVGYADERAATVTRVEPVSGREQWTTVIDSSIGEPPDPRTGTAEWLQVAYGYVVVHGPLTAVLSADDGSVLGTWQRDLGAWAQISDGADVQVTDRGFAVWQDDDGFNRSTQGTWFGRDGRQVQIDGHVAEPGATDGSDPDVLLVDRGEASVLVGLDLTSGRDLWTLGLHGGEVLLRRDGAVVICDGQRVVAVDLRTGTERWSRPVEGVAVDAGWVTDGRSVVVTASRGGDWVLEAIALDDGAVRWTVLAPEPVQRAELFAGPNRPFLTQVGGHALMLRQQSGLGLR